MALFLERSSGGSTPLGFTQAVAFPPAVPTDNLYSDDTDFPLTAGLRLEISHKITDYVTLSATYWGLQQWSVGNTIYGDNVTETVLAYSPYLQLSAPPSQGGIGGFDNTLGYTYNSQVENVEFNALLRLNSDTSYWQFDWLWGVRYVYLADQFKLSGNDTFTGAEEDLASSTTNSLIGVQTGLLLVRGWERFQWETGLKAGLMANIYHQHLTDTISGLSNPPPGYDISSNGTGVAGLFEVSVAARVRITEFLWLRLGYQFYDFTGLALGPRQLNAFGHGRQRGFGRAVDRAAGHMVTGAKVNAVASGLKSAIFSPALSVSGRVAACGAGSSPLGWIVPAAWLRAGRGGQQRTCKLHGLCGIIR